MHTPPPVAAPQPVAPAALQVTLLGRFEVRLAGELLRFPYAKVAGLMVRLLLEPQPQPRELLTELLWPGHEAETARANLRNAVHALRRLLGAHRVLADRHSLRLLLADGDATDLMPLVEALRQPLAPADVPVLLLKMDACESGPLAGLVLHDAPPFMVWLDTQRLALHRQLQTLCERLQPLADGDAERAIGLARLQARLDPWQEDLQLRLVQLLAQAGRLQAALAHVAAVQELFRREADVQPGPALMQLAASLRAGTSATPPLPPPPTAATATATAPAALPTHDGRGLSPPPLRPMVLLHLELRAQPPHGAAALPDLHAARAAAQADLRHHGAHACIGPDGGITAYFGYPDGLPNASQRALAVVQRWAERGHVGGLLWRAALHQGPMALGTPTAPDAWGDLSAVTRRLAEAAHFGQWLASRSLAQRLPQQAWQALTRPLDVYPSDAPGTLVLVTEPADAHAGDRPLVGRATQTAQLGRLWRAARRGGNKAVLVGGPPGSGKSRLARWAVQRLGEGAHTRWLAAHEAHHDAPYAPLAEALRAEIGLQAEAPAAARESAFQAWRGRLAPTLAPAALQMLRWLVGLPADVQDLWPAARRRRLHDALVAWLRQSPAGQPVLLVVEDVHWADPSTLAVLEACAGVDGGPGWMLLATARPPRAQDWQPRWPRVSASPLLPEQARELALRVLQASGRPDAPAAGPGLDEAGLQRLLARADGNPLFIETLALAEARQASAPPDRGEQLLSALTGDDTALRLLRHAAVLGDSLDIDSLRDLLPDLPADGFHAALRRLQRAGLVHRQGQGQALQFHHALIRNAAYDSLQVSERRQLHAAVYQRAMAGLAPEGMADGTASLQADALAWHAARAGLAEPAARHFEGAARRALALAAYPEAVAHHAAALAWVDRLPASPANDRWALRLMLGEAQATVPLRGYGADETRAAYRRVLERGSAQPLDDEVFRAHHGLWLGGSSQGGYREALRYAERLQRFAQTSGRPVHWMQAHYAYGNTQVWLGELDAARQRLLACLALHASDRPADLLDHYSEDTGVTALSLLAWVAWLQGDDAQALALQDRAIALGRSLGHAYSLAFGLACAGRLNLMRGDAPRLGQQTAELLALADRHEFAIWQATGALLQGWLLCRGGDAAGVQQLDAGMALVSQVLPALEVTFLSMQADALWQLGRPADCAQVLRRALRQADHWTDHYMQPELWRLLAACEPAAPQAGTWRAQARALALAQGAQAWLHRLQGG